MTAESFDKLTLKEMVEIYNRLDHKYNDGASHIRKFADRKTAIRRVTSMLTVNKDRVIFLLQPDYVKSGKSAQRSMAFYRDGLLTSEYIQLCADRGFGEAMAKRDLRYDNKKGIIRLV